MKKRRGCIKVAAVAVLSLVALALVVLCPLAFLYTRQLDQARAEFAPPTVFVTEPVSGASAPTGSYLVVSATAMGISPIMRVELWVNGEVVETEEYDRPEGTSPFYAHFDLLASEGPQLLFVRAVNTGGIIGQSLPVAVVGEPGPSEVFLAVSVEEGETLADIAAAYEADPEVLEDLNPDLGGQEPPEGTVVVVPAPPEDGEEPSPPSAGPSLPPTAAGSSPVPLPDIPALKPIQPLPIAILPAIPVVVPSLSFPPTAPSDLQGQVENCIVRLRWHDNAHNELRYEVWMAALATPPRLIASLEPAAGGPAWVEFPAPRTGGVSFWVEAVGLVGRQPSNIVWVEVDPQCPTTSPTHLYVEALDMSVRGNYDRVYCYVSFEDTPEKRLPQDDSAFIEVRGGQADIAAWAAGSRKLTVPIPGDGSLDIAGQCWGWSGEALDRLGLFSGKFDASAWDGVRHPLEGGSYQIGVAVAPFGAMQPPLETYCYNDPSLPVPYDVREEACPSSKPECNYGWKSPARLLRWKWDGGQKKITGFVIFQDGVAYSAYHVRADEREYVVSLPGECGRHIKWQVAAVAGEAQSNLSAPFEYDMAECGIYVRVWFDTIRLRDTSDGLCRGCCTLQAYYNISANTVGKKFWGPNFFMPMECGSYYFRDIAPPGEPHPDVLTVAMGSDQSKPIDLWVRTRFWDHDTWDPNDDFGRHTEHYWFPNLQSAQDSLGWAGKTFNIGTHHDDDADTTVWIRLEVFPNVNDDTPPGWPFY